MRLPRVGRSIVLALVFATSATTFQEGWGQTTAVEIVGLQSWTRQMVEDSVAAYVPGISLADAACVVILRDSVGFADAAVTSFSFGVEEDRRAMSPLQHPEVLLEGADMFFDQAVPTTTIELRRRLPRAVRLGTGKSRGPRFCGTRAPPTGLSPRSC